MCSELSRFTHVIVVPTDTVGFLSVKFSIFETTSAGVGAAATVGVGGATVAVGGGGIAVGVGGGGEGVAVGDGAGGAVALAVGFGAGVAGAGVGSGVEASVTVMVPRMESGWIWQKYGYLPTSVKVKEKVEPWPKLPLSHRSFPDVTVCDVWSWLVHWTAVPTSILWSSRLKLSMLARIHRRTRMDGVRTAEGGG